MASCSIWVNQFIIDSIIIHYYLIFGHFVKFCFLDETIENEPNKTYETLIIASMIDI